MPAASSERRLLALLWVVAFVVMMDGRMVVTILPEVADDLGVTVAAAGLILTAYLVPYGLCGLVYGPLADRLGPLRVMSAASVVFVVVVAAGAAAPTLAVLAIARFAAGAVASAFFPLALVAVGSIVPYDRRQPSIAALTGAVAGGTIAGAALGGVLAEAVGWRAMPLIAAALMAGLVVPLRRVRLLVPPAASPARGLAAQRALLRDRRALTLLGVVAAEGVLAFAGQGFLGALLHERDGVRYGEVGVILAIEAAATLIASRQMGAIRRRLSEDAAITAGLVLMGAAFLGLLGLGGRAAVVAMVPLGVGFVLAHTTFQTRATEISPGNRGAAISLFVVALFLGSGGGTAVLAAVLDRSGYDALVLLCGAGLLALAPVAPALTRPRAARAPAAR